MTGRGCDNGAVTEIPNVLAQRYASAEMVALWSPEHKVRLERDLWIAVLRAQADLGIAVPDGTIEAYEAVRDQVDLASIAAREKVTRHDVKARIEEFADLAGHEHIHKGMTSRDLTENVEQLQVRLSLLLVRDRVVATLSRLGAPRGPVLRPAADRPQPQRRRADHDAGQAVRLRRRGADRRLRPARGPDRALPAARDQGPRRHGPGHARPPRRRLRAGWRELEQRRRRAPGLHRGAGLASARSTRAPSTTTCSPRWSRSPPDRRAWPPRSG